jgi:hypothetical protein
MLSGSSTQYNLIVMTDKIISNLKRLIIPVGTVVTTIFLANTGSSNSSSTKVIPIICTFLTFSIFLIKVPGNIDSSHEKGNNDEE